MANHFAYTTRRPPFLLVAWFQTSAATYMRTALPLAVTQRVVVILCPRFGTTHRSHLQGSRILGFMTLEDGADKLFQSVGKELSLHAAQWPKVCSSLVHRFSTSRWEIAFLPDRGFFDRREGVLLSAGILMEGFYWSPKDFPI